MSRDFRLPDGRVTRSAKTYCKAWDALIDPIAAHFDLRPHSFDPAITFVPKDSIGGDSIRIPVSFARKLVDLIAQEKPTQGMLRMTEPQWDERT